MINLNDQLDQQLSSKAITAAATTLLPPSSSTLAFLNRTPLSAYFYTGAQGNPVNLVSLLPDQLLSTELPLIIAKKSHLDRLASGLLENFEVETQIGNWVLLSNTLAAGLRRVEVSGEGN